MIRIRRYLKFFLPAFLCVLLFGATIFVYIIPRAESALLAKKRDTVKDLTNTACSLLEAYEKLVQDGVMSLGEAQALAAGQIGSMRHGMEGNDYFWINDLKPRMVMHPFLPELNGRDLTDYADPNGVRLFLEMVTLAKERGQGWVSYSWQWKDDRESLAPKISYVRLFEPWSWIVGTGIYLDDVRSEMSQWVQHLAFTGIAGVIALALLSGFLAYRSLKVDLEKARAMAALKSSEHKFASVFREFPGWVVISTKEDGIYLEVNDSFLELTGFSREEIIGKSSLDLGTWVDPEDRRRAMRLLNEQGYVRNMEVQRRAASGQVLDMLFSCELIEVDGGTNLLSTSLDITDRKEAERTIRRQEKRMRAILDAVNETILLIDRSGTVLSANQTVCQRLGTTKRDLVGRSIYDLLPPQLAQSRRRKYEAVFDTGHSAVFEDSRNGKHFEQTVYPFINDQGLVEAIVIFARDITRSKEAEEARDKLEAQLRQSQKMESIGTLAGGIAHDFNNILGAIMGFGELAQLDLETGRPIGKHLEQILNAVERARDLVKQILAFSRRSETDLKPVDVNQVVMRCVKMLDHTIPKMIDIQMQLDGNLETVKADAGQLEQVIMNLASNAKDAMPDGGRMVFESKMADLDQEYCDGHLEVAPGRYVLLSVSDTGEGMDQATLSQIFDPFFTTKEIGKGTGLGLSMVYGIIKGHGGHVSCYSEPGLGSTFKVYLPALPAAAPSQKSAPGPATELPHGTETVLLVDDEEAIRDVARAALADKGYRVLETASGEEALQVYQSGMDSIDLVILDIGMPGMGGHQCLQRLMALDPKVKVIIASGYSKNGSIKSTIENGAKSFVAKPFSQAELLNTVRQVLDA